MNQLTSHQQEVLARGLSAFAAASRRRRLRRTAVRCSVGAAMLALVATTAILLRRTDAPELPAYVEIITGDLELMGELQLASACERIERMDGQLRVVECLAMAPAR